MNISFTKNAYATNGSALESKSIDWLLSYSYNLNPKTEKGKDGAVFAYDADVAGIHNDSRSGGLLFIDIDNLSKKEATKIFDGFQLIADYLPSLYAVQYSSSHFLSETKSGLHFFVTTKSRLDRKTYSYLANLAYAWLLYFIKREFEIDLRLRDGAIDNHNSKMYQKFFVHYSPYKKGLFWSEEAMFDEKFISKDNINFLKQEYGKFLRLTKQTKDPVVETVTNISAIDTNKDKLLIDRNFVIGGYAGNDVRWRISNIALQVFGDRGKAKEWCDRYFYRIEKRKEMSIFSCNRPTAISRVIQDWLVSNGYLVVDEPDGTQERANDLYPLYDGLRLGDGEYMSDRKREVLDFINNHERIEIVAPTGTGKTILINEIAEDLNAVVIVPFNVTNKLYDMTCISSEKDVEVPGDKPCTMVWDQAIMHWVEIKDRVLIVDEAHCLFLDRNYRDAAVKLMLRLKDRKGKLILFTATPSGETDELKCDVLKVYKHRDPIPVNIIKVNQVDYAQYNAILRALKNGWYDRVVMFDDRNARKIYEKLTIEGELIGDVAYIRADTKKTDDFISLRESEILNKKLTICTCVAFNGLNFKNKDERILVVTSWVPGETTANELIQEVGRVRDSKVQMMVFWDGGVKEDTLNARIETAETLAQAEVEMDISSGLLEYDSKLLDSGYVAAVQNIQDYVNEHSMQVPRELSETGYMIVSQIDKQTEQRSGSMRLEMKKKENKEFVSDIDNVLCVEYEPVEGNKYKIGWQRRLRRLIQNTNYKGVDIELIKEILKNKKADVMIETVLNDIDRIIMVSLLTDNQWASYESQIEDVKRLVGNNPMKQKRLGSQFKKDKQFRLKYKDTVKSNTFDDIDLSDLFGAYLGDVKDEYGNFKERSGAAARKMVVITSTMPESKRSKYQLQIGDEFNGCSSLAERCGIGNWTISEWRKKGWVE